MDRKSLYSEEVLKALNNSQLLAKNNKNNDIGTEHILAGYFTVPCRATRRLREAGINENVIFLPIPMKIITFRNTRRESKKYSRQQSNWPKE